MTTSAPSSVEGAEKSFRPMTAKKKHPFRLLILTLFVLSIISLGIWLSFLWLRDSSYLRDELSTFFSQKLNITATSEKIELNFFPFPCLTITDLNMDTGKNFYIHIEKTLIFPDLVSLATGKIDINKIRIKKISVTPETGPKDNNVPTLVHLAIPDLPVISELFSMLPTTQNDLVVTIEDFHHILFHRMDGSIIISPERKKISGKIFVRDLYMDDRSPLNLIPDKTVSALTTHLITTDFSLTDKAGLKINLTVASPEIYLKEGKLQKVSGGKIEVMANATANQIELSIAPFTLDSPHLTLAADFAFNRETNSSELKFKGENIQIASTRGAALELLKQNHICQELFGILRNGFIPEINVSFSSDSLKTLFNPKTMVIIGSVNQGNVQIPHTKLTVTDIQTGVTMENGILHIHPTHGRVVGGAINKGALWVDILGKSNDFKGEFDLTADLDGLAHTLKLLLPETLLANELDRCSKISGNASGTLELESIRGDLSVSVRAKNIALEGEYDRIPGIINLTASAFTFDEQKIYVDDLNLTSDLGDFSNVNAGITLGNNPLLTMETGSGKLDISPLFAWLIGFKPIQGTLSPLMAAQGTIILDHIHLKGPIMSPKELYYAMEGSFTDLNLPQKKGKNSQSMAVVTMEYPTPRQDS